MGMKLLTKIQNLWLSIMSLMSDPWTAFHKARKSPLVIVLAVVFVVQPLVDFGISVVSDYSYVQEKINPGLRPITEEEFNLLNIKVNAVHDEVEQVERKMAIAEGKKPTDDDADKAFHNPSSKTLSEANGQLMALEQKLNAEYIKKHEHH